MGNVVAFRSDRGRPWAPMVLRVGIDFNRWCVSFYRCDKLVKRESFDGEGEARAAAAALVQSSRFVLGPDMPPCITYQSWLDDDGGDCA